MVMTPEEIGNAKEFAEMLGLDPNLSPEALIATFTQKSTCLISIVMTLTGNSREALFIMGMSMLIVSYMGLNSDAEDIEGLATCQGLLSLFHSIMSDRLAKVRSEPFVGTPAPRN